MERKLAEYRARKRKEEILSTAKKSLYKMVTLQVSNSSSDKCQECDMDSESVTPLLKQNQPTIENVSSNGTELSAKTWTWLKVYCYTLLWIVLYTVAIQLEFGTVYLIVSSLYIIWVNTRTGPKRKGEISAYSVFNPNCESIDGTLKAEQFEREIRYGPASVH